MHAETIPPSMSLQHLLINVSALTASMPSKHSEHNRTCTDSSIIDTLYFFPCKQNIHGLK
jgi:hypothetical protein